MADSTVTFNKGDSVLVGELGQLIYGCNEGPFPVVKTEQVISRCDCGFAEGYRPFMGHDKHCGILNQKKAGHHQNVTIKINGKEIVFSGFYLTLVQS